MRCFHAASLTARLVFLFAVVAMATFAGVRTYLYHSLSLQLETRDDNEPLGKIRGMSHLVQEAKSVAVIRKDPHKFLDAAIGHDQLIVLLKSGDGNLIASTHPEKRKAFSFEVAARNENTLGPSDVSVVRLGDGSSARALAIETSIDKTNERVRIMYLLGPNAIVGRLLGRNLDGLIKRHLAGDCAQLFSGVEGTQSLARGDALGTNHYRASA